MLAAAEVHPFHIFKVHSEFIVENAYCPFEYIGPLLAHSVKVQPFYAAHAVAAEVSGCYPETRAGGARVVNFRLYFGILRVNAQAAAYLFRAAGYFGLEFFPLRKRIKNDVVAVPRYAVKFVFPVSR